ncbi:hypothetical protein A0H81_08449 [Grifola frondosa]|uniref:MYND-type domain-containing protein n=1 Tax=Grifola frondosa TaxID=5627 RepID=A0A1C7M994_GRIFR|nr:hypothetical protein A0H81_08449 [Grifola frondosa]
MEVGSGGLRVTAEMEELMRLPGYINNASGGQKLRDLYQKNSMSFRSDLLNRFAFMCYLGILEEVVQMVTAGVAPDLLSTETPYKFGYATLVVAGSQRACVRPIGTDYAAVMNFLLSRGTPPDVEDIVGYTALHHATMNSNARPDLARILLQKGANVNHRDRYGGVPLMGAFMNNQIPSIDLLMEFGADLDIMDADNATPNGFFLRCGPQVTAAVTKWIRKRAGEAAPMDEKKCDSCAKSDLPLKRCSKCHAAQYCSTSCQRTHWPTHKRTCQPFTPSNTVSVRPCYDDIGDLMPMAAFTRRLINQANRKQ